MRSRVSALLSLPRSRSDMLSTLNSVDHRRWACCNRRQRPVTKGIVRLTSVRKLNCIDRPHRFPSLACGSSSV
jgi:hypothetical protein